MISKNLFFKLIRQDLKKRIWCPIVMFIALFLVLEVRLLMATEDMLNHPDAYAYDLVTFVREDFFGRDMAMLSVVICGAAFLCGISGFAYLHAKTQIDLYHSLPVSRSQLFWSKYISGILQFFLPFVIHTLICAGIAAGRNAFAIGTISSIAVYIGLELLVFLLAYSVSVIAAELTGNMIIAILGTGVLFSYSAIITILVTILFHRFFQSYAVYGRRLGIWISDGVWCFSPLSMILKLFSSPNNTTMEEAEKLYKYDVSYVWFFIMAVVVYSLAAYFIYRKRASEAAGRAIAFGAAEPVIKAMVVIPCSYYIAYFFSVISSDTVSDGWFLFGLIFGFVVLCVLMEIIFRLDIRGAFLHKKQFVFNAVCVALLFIVLKYDVTGYDTYVPADAQIQSCAVSIQQLMPLAQNVRVNEFGVHYLNADEYRMANMEIQGNPSVMELARKAAKEQLAFRYFDYYEGIEESPEYIETLDRQENYRSIAFGYKLLNGKTVYREYYIDIADADTIGLLSDIFGDHDYKIGATPLFNDNWKITFESVYCKNNFQEDSIKLMPDMQSELIETYQQEYMQLTLDTVMHVVPLGTIEFIGEFNVFYSGEMYVYPQFTRTIALLREYGFDMEEKLTADDGATISVQKNNYGETDIVSYTDREQIQQILDNVISEEFSWDISSFAGFFDKQYTVLIHFDAEDSRHSNYYCFMEGQIPDFVK